MNRQASITFLHDQIMVADDTLRSKLVDEGITFDSIADFDEEDICVPLYVILVVMF
jgi:hypothetical protein